MNLQVGEFLIFAQAVSKEKAYIDAEKLRIKFESNDESNDVDGILSTISLGI